MDDEQPTKKRTISRSPSPPRISSTDRKSNLKEQKSIRRHHESSLRSRQHVESTQHRHKRRADSPKRGVEIVVHEEAPKPYFVDVEGDKGNVSYGSLHRYAVPFYRRLGAGSILGRPSYEKIDRNVSLPGFITLADRDASSAVRDKGLLARALPRAARETHVRPTDLKTVHPGSDYLSLQDSDAPSKSLEEDRNDDSSVDEAIVEYRSIDGKAKAINQPDDPDLVYGSIPSSGDKKPPAHDAEEALRKKGMRILQRVDQQPDNINTWMELIQHQDELLVDSNDIFDKGITHAQRLSTTDMKLSMYEKALASVNDRSAQERLLLGLMDEGMKIWDTEKTIARWQAILLEKSTHPGLWVEYLNFRQSSFTTFRYEEVRQIYVECLSKLREAHQSQAGKHLYQMQLYVVLRLTTLMKEAGYVENAIAIWQAILEFSIRGFQSPETGQLNDDNISILQSFWDSEVLRIGEDGAIGLAQFAVSGGEAPQPLNGSSSAEMSDNICIEKWAMLEWERAMHSRMPARTLDEVGEDDPYRVILFSDLQDFILDPPQHKDHVLLATAFLSFCGLPPLPDSEYRERSNSWDEDPFIRSGVLHEQVTEKTSGPLRNTDDPFTIPTKSCVISTECLFSQSAPWYVCFDEWMATSTNDGGDLQRSFVRLALKTIVNDRSSSDDKLGMAEYFLGFENCAFPRTVKKNGKGLLKDHPSSMKLWNAYALCELGAGKRSNAETVIVTNINSKGSIAAGAVGDAIVLWKSWLWEILGAGEPQKTLKCLLLLPQREVQPCLDNSSTASNTQPEASPSSLLRTERVFICHKAIALKLLTQALDSDRRTRPYALNPILYLSRDLHRSPTSLCLLKDYAISMPRSRTFNVHSKLQNLFNVPPSRLPNSRTPPPTPCSTPSLPRHPHLILQTLSYPFSPHGKHHTVPTQYNLPIAIHLERSSFPDRRSSPIHHERRSSRQEIILLHYHQRTQPATKTRFNHIPLLRHPHRTQPRSNPRLKHPRHPRHIRTSRNKLLRLS